jgi:hypothetical protein
MERVRADCLESEVQNQTADGETYDGVEEYDPVLRSHCRLVEPRGEPSPMEASPGDSTSGFNLRR